MVLLMPAFIARNTPELRSWLGQREGMGRFLLARPLSVLSLRFLPRWVQSWGEPGHLGCR